MTFKHLYNSFFFFLAIMALPLVGEPVTRAICTEADLVTNQVLRHQIKFYYDTIVSQAFASAEVDAFATIFDLNITKPMSYEEIKLWAKDFFQKHGSVKFSLTNIEFENVEADRAIVIVAFKVESQDGTLLFSNTEREELIQDTSKGWLITSWEKINP